MERWIALWWNGYDGSIYGTWVNIVPATLIKTWRKEEEEPENAIKSNRCWVRSNRGLLYANRTAPVKVPSNYQTIFQLPTWYKTPGFWRKKHTNNVLYLCLTFFLSFFLPVFHSLSQIRNDKLNSKASLLQDAHQMTTLKSNQKKKSC